MIKELEHEVRFGKGHILVDEAGNILNPNNLDLGVLQTVTGRVPQPGGVSDGREDALREEARAKAKEFGTLFGFNYFLLSVSHAEIGFGADEPLLPLVNIAYYRINSN